MTNILAIETSGPTCSVAVNHDGNITQVFEATPREHAKKVLPMVDDLLKQTGLSMEQVDAIAFSKGPGSFTGLRIGFGIVQGLAFGCAIPVIGVSSLQALSYKAGVKVGVQEGVVVPALDARMDEIYYGVYRYWKQKLPEVIQLDSAIRPSKVPGLFNGRIDVAVGDGWQYINMGGLDVGNLLTDCAIDAKTLAELAFIMYQQGQAIEIIAAELSYVRNEISWKKRERIRTNK